MRRELWVIDSVGAQRGMHYFNFPLVAGLAATGGPVRYLSTPATIAHADCPTTVATRAPFRHIYGTRPKWQRGLAYAVALWRIFWLALRLRPSVCHFHFFQIPTLDRLLLRGLRLLGIRVSLSVHDVVPFGAGQQGDAVTQQRLRQLYGLCDHLIVHSQHAATALKALAPTLTARVAVVAQGHYLALAEARRLPRASAKQRLGIAPDAPLLLVFGTIKPNKRLDIVLEAVATLLPQQPKLQLLIAGKPREQDVAGFQAQATALGLDAHVHWQLDVIADEMLAVYYCAADIVLFPYAWIYQSAALVMALSFACPVLASDVGSNGEWVIDEETGRLAPLTVPTFTDTLQQMLNNPAATDALGAAAQQYVAQHLDWQPIAQSLRLQIAPE